MRPRKRKREVRNLEDKTWLINGNALKKAFIDEMKTCKSTVAVRFWSIAIDAIQDKAFRADAVEVVHGRWLELGSDDTDDFCWQCSNCNEVMFEYPGRNNYCPHCGAKMDGVN